MLNKIQLEDILFLDIETVPEEADFNVLSEEKKMLYDSKTKYQRTEGILAADFYHNAGIWAEFGKIICISVGFFTLKNENKSFRVRSFFGEEQKILQDFSALLNQFFSQPQHLLCGHNVKEFDFPYMIRRMIIHGMPVPNKLQLFGRKPWEVPHLDTLELWKFGDYKHFTSLKLLTNILKIASPKDDIEGSDVAHTYYVENDLQRIVRYCEKDTIAIAQILLRVRGEELLRDDEIIIVLP